MDRLDLRCLQSVSPKRDLDLNKIWGVVIISDMLKGKDENQKEHLYLKEKKKDGGPAKETKNKG